MEQRSTIAAIILAAGTSSRMGAGRHKLLLPLAGRPVLAHVIEAALASQARPIIIVLGHRADEMRTRMSSWFADPTIIVVDNVDHLQGMSTSMRAGIEQLIDFGYKKHIDVDGALIMLGDQPLITPYIIDALIHARRASGKRIVAPLFEGKRGNPVLFSRDLFPELLEVSGDEGGRSVVERHRDDIATVELSDAAIRYDVDTWEAYQEVLAAWGKNQ